MRRLRDDIIALVTGGAWNFSTLTSAELSEYNALEEARIEAENTGDWSRAKTIEVQINAFIDRMDLLYGA